jgi:hypothetical protein
MRVKRQGEIGERECVEGEEQGNLWGLDEWRDKSGSSTHHVSYYTQVVVFLVGLAEDAFFCANRLTNA